MTSWKQKNSYQQFSKLLEKSNNDQRNYRLIKLENNLECLLINDNQTDKASVAIDVKAGHLLDPKELQGLAHFNEHMLFLGTSKYPVENDYQDYLSKNSGYSNAYTDMIDTNYYFTCSTNALKGAVDRFSQFFIAPLFTQSCTQREVKAVDSENKKNLQSDLWRLFQLEKGLSNAPLSNFGTGNWDTLYSEPSLKGMDPREELIKWYETHYSSHLMKLCVLGKESLDELEQLTVENFSAIPQRNIPEPQFSSNVWPEDAHKSIIFAETIKDLRQLTITFKFPEQDAHYNTKPGNFLSHILGYEGKGSLCSYLKQLGHINSLSAGFGFSAPGFEFFKINLDLTTRGVGEWKQCLKLIFNYIDMMKKFSDNPPEYLFRETQDLATIAFRFKEQGQPEKVTSSVARLMQKPYEREHILSGSHLVREYEPNCIKESLNALNLDNCRVLLAAKDPIEGVGELDRTEKWYGTKYRVDPLPEELLNEIRNTTSPSEMHLPHPNQFIPKNFDVEKKEVEEPSITPALLRDTKNVRLWHKKDDQWWVPKAHVYMIMKSPSILKSAKASVTTRLFNELLLDEMNEYAYDAECAGFAYSIESTGDGILIHVKGYNDKLTTLLHQVISTLKNLHISEDRFNVIKERIERVYANFSMDAPLMHANVATYSLTQKVFFTFDERLEAVKSITKEDVENHAKEFLERLYLELFIHGNVTDDSAIQISKDIETVLQPASLSEEERQSLQSSLVPQGDHVYVKKVQNPAQINSAIEYYNEVGDVVDLDLRTKLSLFAQIVHEPAFDQLRTKEQLGYMVFSGMRKSIGAMGFRVLIQSERPPAFLEQRIEEFYDVTVKNLLESMTEEAFEKNKNSLMEEKLEKPKNLNNESSRLWVELSGGYYDFTRRLKEVESTKKITKEDILNFFYTYIHQSSDKRSKLSTHLVSQSIPEQYKEFNSVESLRPSNKIYEDIPSYKTQAKTSSHAKPVAQIPKPAIDN
ncbi:a-pheromone processing metallopeptidase Ste23 [Wallemia mellicola]|nr:a-pheromone processing metallopeptidase Ste23 [Wallemia mellicola]